MRMFSYLVQRTTRMLSLSKREPLGKCREPFRYARETFFRCIPNRYILTAILLALLLPISFRCTSLHRMTAENLTCEYRRNPLGIDTARPRLSWQCASVLRGDFQTAYRVLVASNPEKLQREAGDIWDSGKIQSAQCLHVPYAGPLLQSDRSYFWKVRIWDKNNEPSAWSETASWSTGLLQKSDWQGQWIGLDRAVGEDVPDQEHRRLAARYLRKEFSFDKKVQRATAFISGLGLFELAINGEKIGDQVLAPALSEYDKRVYYMTFDVTQHLQRENAVAIILGNGRFFAPRITEPAPTRTFGFPKLLFQLNVLFADSSSQTIISDESWKLTAAGPIRANNEYDGEFYDARMEMPGWNRPGFDDRNWQKVEIVKAPAKKIVAQMAEPIKITETIHPVSVQENEPGVFIYDMGQNMVGWVQVYVKGKRGDKVTMRFAESLTKDDGRLYLENIRDAEVTDTYILKGRGNEIWQPRFTYHGFRYVEVRGRAFYPALTAIEGKVVHDAVRQTGQFYCSDETVNRVYRNAIWGIRGNYRSMPTDCPQRDERHGWLGDRAVESLGESYIFNIAALYKKWLHDIQDTQLASGSLPDVAPSYWPRYTDNMTWPGAFVIFPGMLYRQYADIDAIQQHYPAMKKWLDYMAKYVSNGIMMRDTYGDWCVPPLDIKATHTSDPGRMTSAEFIGTAYYYYLLRTLKKYALLLDKPADAEHFSRTAERVYAAFNRHFFDRDLQQLGNNSQTSNVLALAFDLLPPVNRKVIFNNLADKILGENDGHIGTGLVGTQWLMRVLTNNGRSDIAFKLASQKTYPGWGYMAVKGATTIWELWNGDTGAPGMNSRNHVMLLGDFLPWLYENLAGIQSDFDRPAFKHALMKPEIPPGLHFVDAVYHSMYGEIKSSWKIEDEKFYWNVTIPANTTATIFIPADMQKFITENGKPVLETAGVKFIKQENGRAVFDITSGEFEFVSPHFSQKIYQPFVSTPSIVPADTILKVEEKILVKLADKTPGAQIHFTLDGSKPDKNSTVYNAPIPVESNMTIRARAFRTGSRPSIIKTACYDFVKPAVNGIRWKLYHGAFVKIPDFSQMQATKSGVCYQIGLSELPVPKVNFALDFTTYIKIDQPGTYKFFINSNDGSRLFIDGKLLIDNDGEHSPKQLEKSIYLKPGQIPLQIKYFQSGGTTTLSCSFQGPGIERQKLPASRLFLKKD